MKAHFTNVNSSHSEQHHRKKILSPDLLIDSTKEKINKTISTSKQPSSSLSRIHENDISYATTVIFGELNMTI